MNAPKVGLEEINRLLAKLEFEFWIVPDTNATICAAILPKSGTQSRFVVETGMSASISAENFNKEIGEAIAKTNAINAARDKLWELEGYALRKMLG